MNGHHLAQLNIARPVAPPGSAQLADFMAGLDLVNGIAARSPGFVWRLKDESGNATSLHGFDDPALIINMSVWESPGHLEQFVWQTVHKRFDARKGEWFEKTAGPHFVMWWIAAGTLPTLQQAREKLAYFQAHGASEHAFGWESLPNIKLWMSARCA